MKTRMKKAFILFISVLMTLSLAIGCTATPTTTSTTAATTQGTTAEGTTKEGTQTSEATTEATSTEATNAQDKPDIEIFINPWVGIALEGVDPYRQWLDNLTNANWTLTYASDFNSELITRAAASDMPDLIGFDSSADLFNLYDEGVLLEDWTPYAADMPQTFENMGDTAKMFYTKEGMLTCVTTKPGEQLWAFNIRKDWLTNLNLSMPTTVDELLAVAKAFTFDDPDKNGKDDTFGFTSAGGNGIGEIISLELLYGPLSYYVTADKNVSSYIVDGNLLKFVTLMKQIVDEGIINPDWYTIGWDERKPNLYNGMYGISWYPPEALLTETDGAREGDGVVEGWWEYMPLFDASGNGTGGKLNGQSPFGAIRTVSADAAADEVKMKAIVTFLETTAIPHREYYIFRAGVDIDTFVMKEIGSRVYIDGLAAAKTARKGDGEGQNLGFANYGKIINSYSAEANVVWGTTPEPSQIILNALAMSEMIINAPRHDNTAFLLDLDKDKTADANTVYNEFMINYIQGKTTDYDAFVSKWLQVGGQELLDEAKQQFTDYGVIN